MSKPILIVGGIIIVGLGGFFLFQSSNQKPAVEETGEEMGEMMPPSPEATASQGEHVVVYSDGGYAPKEMTIKKGDKVTFRNESARETWPASAMHPSHTLYPGSSIQKCETEEMTRVFDACMGLMQGEEWSFEFQEVGTWNYHDHKHAEHWGTIIVE